jgi:hypothetical protein
MSNVLKMAAVGGAVSAETDPNFNQTVLLLHGDGTNGAQNNTFLDSSTNNFTITRNGNTTQGTFSPFSLAAGEWSNYFDGTGDRLDTPSNAAVSPGSSDFCFETWVYFSGSGVASRPLYELIIGAPNTNGLFIGTDPTNFIVRRVGVTNIITEAFPPANEWVHIAVTRSGTDWRLFFNGVQQGSTASYSYTFTTGSVRIGSNEGQTAFFNGNLSNYRFVKGSAVYTSNFTPPTTPLTAITNTSLLTCQSNRFVDNSTNAFAITRNGDVRVTPFSPFAPSAAYDPAVNGGSGYFDGTGDYLTVSNTGLFGSGDWHVECWVNAPVGQVDKPILECRNSASGNGSTTGFTLTLITATEIRVYSGAERLRATASYVGTWVHVAVSKKSGTTRLYINGTSLASTASIGTMSDTTFIIGAGYYGSTSLNAFGQFWISGLRVLTGTGFDTSTITVPTAPPTPIANTSLLLNFTNAGIFDNTGKNVLETVGNAQIDTTTKKYGTGSMGFDGTGDWLQLATNVDLDMGSGNFTIEFWINPTSYGSSAHILAQQAQDFTIQFSSVTSPANQLVVYDGSSRVIGSISLSTWTHFALVRSSGTLQGYVNGVATGSSWSNTSATRFTLSNGLIGARWGNANPFTGFIDDLRITKGVARYTANFTAPTKALPDQ